MPSIRELVTEGRPLLVDGAMGTELFARGLTAGDPPEMWNIDLSHHVTDIHKGYIKAGSDIILTNSFGGNSFRLALHNLQDRVFELNEAAAALAADAAAASDRPVVVAGSMGPTGELLEPLGTMTMATAEAAFADQAAGLAAGGADVLWVETMSSLEEAEAAIAGARSACDLPIVVTMSFDTAGCTMMGVTGAAAAARLGSLGLAAVGANCGNNIAETEAAVIALKQGLNSETLLVVKANAGIPEFRGDTLHYSGTPEIMGAHAARMRDAGIDVVGGCCGTSIQHVAYMRDVLDGTIDPPDTAAPGRSPADTASDGRSERPVRRSARRRRSAD